MIDGKDYSWENIEIVMWGVPIKGITQVKYSNYKKFKLVSIEGKLHTFQSFFYTFSCEMEPNDFLIVGQTYNIKLT